MDLWLLEIRTAGEAAFSSGLWPFLFSPQSGIYLFLLSFCLGFVQALSPDRWVPLSVLSWKGRWSSWQTAGWTVAAACLHLVAGLILSLWIHLLVTGINRMLPEEALPGWALSIGMGASVSPGVVLGFLGPGVVFALLVGGTLLRAKGLSRLGEVFFWDSRFRADRGLWSVLLWMGPAEWLTPIALRSVHRGTGFLVPFLGFGIGLLLSQAMMILRAKRCWKDPSLGSWFYAWAQTRLTWAPVLMALLVLAFG